MPKIFSFFLMLTALVAAGQEPVFDKQYFRCENKWVLLPKKEADTSYTTAFLYLDREAGFSMRLQGDLYKDGRGKWLYAALPRKQAVIYRIPQDFQMIAIVPEQVRAATALPDAPDWVWDYREGEDDPSQLVRRGYYYNHVGGSDIGLPLLQRAYVQEPGAEGLIFELSYAYNALERYDDAVAVLLKALKQAPKDAMLLKELGYAYAQKLQAEEAEQVFRKGILYSRLPDQQAEMAFNMLGMYFKTGNRKKFDEWSDVMKKYAAPDSDLRTYQLQFEKELDKKQK